MTLFEGSPIGLQPCSLAYKRLYLLYREPFRDQMTDLRSAYDAAIGWLINSHIRTPSGGYRSIYKPGTHEYVNWYNNETCLVSTAGAVLALDACGHEDLALESATYICGLAIVHDKALQGAILSGKGGRSIFANWIGSAIVALLRAYERSGQERFLAVAASAGRFVINRMQNADGSINQELSPAGSSALHGGILQPRQIWLANCVEAWLALHAATGDKAFKVASDRFVSWLLDQQKPDGSFPMFQRTVLSRTMLALLERRLSEAIRGCECSHPAATSHSIKALMLVGRTHEARLAAKTLTRGLSARGLLYQYYLPDQAHSVEEDVMPTAHFGLLALEYPSLGINRAVVKKIAEGMIYAQIQSSDPDADGGMKGMPLHRDAGEHAYCWDTAHGLRFLQKFLSDDTSDPAVVTA